MKDLVSEELKENERKVFIKKKTNSKMNRNYTSFEVNGELIYKRRDEFYTRSGCW